MSVEGQIEGSTDLLHPLPGSGGPQSDAIS